MATSPYSNELSRPDPPPVSQPADPLQAALFPDHSPPQTRHDTGSRSSPATQYPDPDRHRRASRFQRAARPTAKSADDLNWLCGRLEIALELAPRFSDEPRRKYRFMADAFGDAKNAMSIAHASSVNVERRNRSIINGLKVASELLDSMWKELFRFRNDLNCLRPTLKDLPEKNGDELIKIRHSLAEFMSALDELNANRQQLELFADSVAKVARSGVSRQAYEEVEIGYPMLISGALELLAPVARLVVSLNNFYLHTFAWPVDVRQSLGTIALRSKAVFDLFEKYNETKAKNNAQEASKKKAHILCEILGALKLLDIAANHLAQTASENWRSEDSGKWNEVLRFAERLGDFTSPLQAIVLPMVKRSQNDTGESSHAAGLQGATDAQEVSGVETVPPRRRSHRRTPPQRHEVGRVRSADTAEHSEILKQVSALLDKSKRLPPDVVRYSANDLLALARRAGCDTSTIDTIKRNESDPLDIASIIRDSVASWFGRVTDLERALRMLAALPQSPQIAACANKVAQRKGLLAHIEACMNQQEADLIKQYLYPKARHLHRLFDLDEVALVQMPKKLPSSSDQDNQGTVFELCVQPHPISDGDNAAPLFVHVHTRRTVTADGCLTLELSDFNAIHVKTKTQKNLGKQWERYQRALGNTDPTIHRGQVDEKLWRRLKEKAVSAGSPERSPVPALSRWRMKEAASQ
ncbi:hypothetical protein [Paraburkholderia ribeironis]|nr:hypothetical protein [Paraburkholderia ribeironis]